MKQKQMQVVGSYAGNVGLHSLAHKRKAFLKVPGVRFVTVWVYPGALFMRITVTGRDVLRSDAFQAVVDSPSLVHGEPYPTGVPVGAKKVVLPKV